MNVTNNCGWFVGPFFRVEQLIITSKEKGQNMIDYQILNQILDIQLYVMNEISVEYEGRNYTIDDLCFKAIPGELSK